jgi:hypothetical protein
MKLRIIILFLAFNSAARGMVLHEEIITDVPLPPTSFNHLPIEIKSIILEQAITYFIRTIPSPLQWVIFDETRNRIKQLYLNKACSKIMNDKMITKVVLNELEKKINDTHITCFLGSKVEQPWQLFTLAERLGTKGSLEYITAQAEWPNFFEKLKTYAIKTDNPEFKRKMNAFVIKICGGYSVAEYVERNALKIEDEYVNEIRKYFKEDGVPTLQLSNAGLKTLDGLQELAYSHVRRIKINNNVIHSLEPGRFTGFINLNDIEIKGNKHLKSVDFGMFALLQHLRRLDFSYNGIVHIQCTKKLDSQNLCDLDLRYNALESVDLATVAHINAGSIDLYQNPLSMIISDKPWEASKPIEILLLQPDKVSRFKHLCVEGMLAIR